MNPPGIGLFWLGIDLTEVKCFDLLDYDGNRVCINFDCMWVALIDYVVKEVITHENS